MSLSEIPSVLYPDSDKSQIKSLLTYPYTPGLIKPDYEGYSTYGETRAGMTKGCLISR